MRLVMHLALDWLHATGQQPQKGRDDKRGFGDLVHSVFDWLEVTRDPRQAAIYALRRYWDTEKSAKEGSALCHAFGLRRLQVVPASSVRG